jgi:hypothetical protein
VSRLLSATSFEEPDPTPVPQAWDERPQQGSASAKALAANSFTRAVRQYLQVPNKSYRSCGVFAFGFAGILGHQGSVLVL